LDSCYPAQPASKQNQVFPKNRVSNRHKSDVAGFSGTKGWPQKNTKRHKKRTKRLGCQISDQRLDLRVRGRVIVVLPCVENFSPIHQAQLIFTLKATDLRLGPAEQLQDPKSEKRNPAHRSRNSLVASVSFVVGKMQRKPIPVR
jgi:hypothetical protein